MDVLFPYSESKMKPYLKMAVQRLQIAKNKKTNTSRHEKREIGQLLGKNKEELARIKAEHIIREDFTIEAYEVLELLCELIHERIRLITNSNGKKPPDDMKEAMASIIWASTRLNIEELNEIRNQLRKKYGNKFVEDAIDNIDNIVNTRLIRKLSTEPPSATLVLSYLVEIAKEYKIDWEPTEVGIPEGNEAFTTPTGFSIPMAPGTELRSVYQRYSATVDAADSDTGSNNNQSGTSSNSSSNNNNNHHNQAVSPRPPSSASSATTSVTPTVTQLPPPPYGTAIPVNGGYGNYKPNHGMPTNTIPSTTPDILYFGEDTSEIPVVTAVVVNGQDPSHSSSSASSSTNPSAPPGPRRDGPPSASPPTASPPSAAPPSAGSDGSNGESTEPSDDSFSALQARLAALRNL